MKLEQDMIIEEMEELEHQSKKCDREGKTKKRKGKVDIISEETAEGDRVYEFDDGNPQLRSPRQK